MPPSRRTPWICGWLGAALAASIAAAVQAAPSPESGTPGDDVLIGTPGPDAIGGFGGADRIRGVDGGDVLNGNTGDDTVGGGPGNDEVRGGRGDDQLNGGQGNDTVGGDAGDDTLTGGLGADRFLVEAGGGRDLVTDFASRDGDRIVLPADAAYTVADSPDGVVIRLRTGETVVLAGARTDALGDWLAAEPRTAAPIAPPKPPSRWLLAGIVTLVGVFFVLLAVGLHQLWRGPVREPPRPDRADDPRPGRRRIAR
jgi:hypothetical protein